MIHHIPPGTRSFVAAGFAAAALVALPLRATAQTAVTDNTAPASPSATAAQVVVRDTASGALRAATPAEMNALAQSKGQVAEFRRARVAQPMSKVHADGARGARLTDEFMSYAVVVRQPDGSMANICFDSREEADAAVKAAATSSAKTNPLPTE